MIDNSGTQLQRAQVELAECCPLCSSTDLQSIYTVSAIPVQSCIVLSDREEALNFERRDLDLCLCNVCGFVFNAIFDKSLVDYFQVTEESQHFSGTFNRFSRDLARQIAVEADIGGKTILEIGCGKGEFLLELCAQQRCRGIGIDPGFREDRLAASTEGSEIEFITDYFSADRHAFDPDVILCRHTLEHIPNVADFMAEIRRMIGAKRSVALFFETPDAKRVLEEGAFWDIYYEHCSYFTEGTHARLFRQEGFDVTRSELGYAEQYILQYARPSENGASTSAAPDNPAELIRCAQAFREHVETVKSHWRQFVQKRHAAGKRVVIWGGGSKCVSFVTTLGLQDEIDYVIDINPYKQSKYLPGSGHRVEAPAALKTRPADAIIIMNPIYENEIRQSLEEIGQSPEVAAV